MIKCQLRCSAGHEFEGWFRDGATYDSQAASTAPTAAIPTSPRRSWRRTSRPAAATTGPRLPATTTPRRPNARTRCSPKSAREVAEKILDAANTLRAHVEENCDYVGDKFAEEAKRIHYGEADERGIYGEASGDETEELDEEGIQYFRLPFTNRRND